MKITATKNGGLQIQAETEFEVGVLRNVGVNVIGMLHLERSPDNCYLNISKKKNDDGHE